MNRQDLDKLNAQEMQQFDSWYRGRMWWEKQLQMSRRKRLLPDNEESEEQNA